MQYTQFSSDWIKLKTKCNTWQNNLQETKENIQQIKEQVSIKHAIVS